MYTLAHWKEFLSVSIDLRSVSAPSLRPARAVLSGDVESAISHAFNTAAAAHPEWRDAPPAVSEIVRSIANSMLAVAELFRSYQSVAAYDLVAARSTNDALRARGMGDVESAIRQAIDTAAAAHPGWRQATPAVSEILQSIANSMLATAEKSQSVVGDDVVEARSTNKALRARGNAILASIRMRRLAQSSGAVASEYKALLSVRDSIRIIPATRLH